MPPVKKSRPNPPQAPRTSDATGVGGAQSIQRAVSVLRIVAANAGLGVSLSQVVRASGINKATAHRILRALFEEGLLEQDSVTRNYRLGIEIFALSAAMGDRFDIRAVAQPSLERICEQTQDTVYLAIRSGLDGLCLAMCEGSYPEKTLKLAIRDRWPLGVGAFSMPLLAFLPEDERESIITANIPRLIGQDQYTPAKLRRQAIETRERGYALNQILSYPTMCGVGVPVLDQHERPIASLCVTAVVSRMTAQRQQQVAERLWEESRNISDLWQSVRTMGSQTGSWRAIAPASGLTSSDGQKSSERKVRS